MKEETMKKYACENCGNGKKLYWMKEVAPSFDWFRVDGKYVKPVFYERVNTEVRSTTGICKQCGNKMNEVK